MRPPRSIAVGPDGLRYPAEQIHAIALSDLHGEFATVVDTESVLSVVRASPMTTRALGFTCVAALPLVALLSCATPATAPASPSAEATPDVDRSVDPCTDFDAFANGPGGRRTPFRRSCRAGVGAPRPARRTGASFRSCSRSSPSRRLASRKHRTTPRRSLRLVHGRGEGRAPGSHAAGAVARRHRCDPQSDRPPAEHPASARPGDSGRRSGSSASSTTTSPSASSPTSSPATWGCPAEQAPGARTRRTSPTSSCWRGPRRAAARESSLAILGLETRLAEASLGAAASADPAATDHRMTFTQLQQLAPGVDWSAYFAEAGLPRVDLNVAEPNLLRRLDVELRETPLPVWKAYLRWQLLDSASPFLSKSFVDATGETRPRAQRCLESTEGLLGDALGRKYVERYFPPAAKAKAQEIVRTLLAVLKDDVAALEWMRPETRKTALEKLDAYDAQVGYPDRWKDYAGVEVRRDAFWANVAAGRRFNVDEDRRRNRQAHRARSVAAAALVTRRVHRPPAQPDGAARGLPPAAGVRSRAERRRELRRDRHEHRARPDPRDRCRGLRARRPRPPPTLVDRDRSSGVPDARTVRLRAVRGVLHRARLSTSGQARAQRGNRRSRPASIWRFSRSRRSRRVIRSRCATA